MYLPFMSVIIAVGLHQPLMGGSNTPIASRETALDSSRSVITDSYYTEQFLGDFDLGGMSMTFTPTVDNHYTVCLEPITELPTDDLNTSIIPIDTCEYVMRNVPQPVWLYGQPYNQIYFTTNGQILIEPPPSVDCAANIDRHFDYAGVSALFARLTPFNDIQYGVLRYGASVGDRIAVEWHGFVEWGSLEFNTFSCELFFDGTIRISWLGIGSQSNIVGLSAGTGTPPDFIEDDLSAVGGCDTTIPGDINGDGEVGATDLLLVIAAWGPCPGCNEDVNHDDVVDVSDLLEVVENWG